MQTRELANYRQKAQENDSLKTVNAQLELQNSSLQTDIDRFEVEIRRLPEMEKALTFFQTETKNAKASVHLLQLEKMKIQTDLKLSIQTETEMKQLCDELEYRLKLVNQEKLQWSQSEIIADDRPTENSDSFLSI